VTTTPVSGAANRPEVGDWVERAGKVGLVARGVVYCVLAALAVALATGDRTEETDQRGALSELAERPFGEAMLVVIVAGFCCYGAWRVARAVRGEGGDDDRAWASGRSTSPRPPSTWVWPTAPSGSSPATARGQAPAAPVRVAGRPRA
jgi:hypothetical protein